MKLLLIIKLLFNKKNNTPDLFDLYENHIKLLAWYDNKRSKTCSIGSHLPDKGKRFGLHPASLEMALIGYIDKLEEDLEKERADRKLYIEARKKETEERLKNDYPKRNDKL